MCIHFADFHDFSSILGSQQSAHSTHHSTTNKNDNRMLPVIHIEMWYVYFVLYVICECVTTRNSIRKPRKKKQQHTQRDAKKRKDDEQKEQKEQKVHSFLGFILFFESFLVEEIFCCCLWLCTVFHYPFRACYRV